MQDVLSLILKNGHGILGTELFRAGTWVFLGGAAVSLLAALTGWADWSSSSEPGTQARRTVNAHAIIMIPPGDWTKAVAPTTKPTTKKAKPTTKPSTTQLAAKERKAKRAARGSARESSIGTVFGL